MKIIPVVDVLGGVAVHAIRGIRKDYQPIKSVLCASADSVDLAVSLKAFGFDELYVADLDAIACRQPNFSLLKRIVDTTGLKLMVDAGVTNLQTARKVLANGASKVIIGTETLPSFIFVSEMVASLGKERVIVSLDLRGNNVLSGFELKRRVAPITFLSELEARGVFEVIILDLAKVGSNEGVNIAFLKKAMRNIKARVFVGGGVRDVKDLVELKRLGVYGVLVATALHSGQISPANLKQADLL